MNYFASLQLLIIFFVLKPCELRPSCFCRELQIQNFRSIIRGNYKNMLQEKKGGLVSNRQQIYLVGDQFNKSPLRSEIYYIQIGNGYTTQLIGSYMVIDLLQTYEINTIVFWLFDRDSSLRTYDLKVYLKGLNGPEILIYENTASSSITKLTFPDQFVRQILIYNNNGSSLNQLLHILNLQAYFKI